MVNDRFLRACRRQTVDCTPIWLMRQAGRYLPEYRALRERYALLEMMHAPELAVEVTLQPLRRFELDAAIIFADLLPPLAAMGLDLRFVKGEGPVLDPPVRSEADIDALDTPSPQETLSPTLEAIRLVRAELDGKTPLIGFAGAPFTLASYAIEGGGSRNYVHTKSLMYGRPQAWHRLMEKLARLIGDYLTAQAEAGAQALQVFDSWVGALSPADYREYVLPHSRAVIERARSAGVPVIHFGTGATGLLELIREAGGDVIGVDWRVDLDCAWTRLGDDVAVQGNLDPVALFAPPGILRAQAARVLEQAGGRPGHIFNLGHGILPGTPPEHVELLVALVHERQD